jgi:hypothetical protein
MARQVSRYVVHTRISGIPKAGRGVARHGMAWPGSAGYGEARIHRVKGSNPLPGITPFGEVTQNEHNKTE